MAELTYDQLDPEMSYRRGYQQGAWETFRKVQACLPPDVHDIIKLWIEKDLYEWRLANMRGESGRDSNGLTTGALPPTWRLGNLTHPRSH